MQFDVTIVRADTGGAFDVSLPDDAPVQDLLAELVKEMGLPRLGVDGDVIAYELSNKRTGGEVREGTLAGIGVKPGDVLLLTSTFVAGGFDMNIADCGFVAIGIFGCLSLQVAFALVRRFFGVLSAHERSEALRLDAENRAQEAESRERLADLEIARLGGQSPKRVTARPIR